MFFSIYAFSTKIFRVRIPEWLGHVVAASHIRISVQVDTTNRKYKGTRCRSIVLIHDLIGGIHSQSRYRVLIIAAVIIAGITASEVTCDCVNCCPGSRQFSNAYIIRAAIGECVSLSKRHSSVIILLSFRTIRQSLVNNDPGIRIGDNKICTIAIW